MSHLPIKECALAMLSNSMLHFLTLSSKFIIIQALLKMPQFQLHN